MYWLGSKVRAVYNNNNKTFILKHINNQYRIKNIADFSAIEKNRTSTIHVTIQVPP